jgi:hypothetical protein
MSGALREIMLFELIRSYFHHPFNRYSWVVLADRDGKTVDYYSEEAVKLGHGCSVLAKLVMYGKRDEYWSDNDEWLVIALLELVATRELRELEQWLKLGEELLRETLESRIEYFISEVKKAESKHNQAKILSQKVEERKEFKSAEIVLEGNLDFEDLREDDDDYFTADEDFDRVEEHEQEEQADHEE